MAFSSAIASRALSSTTARLGKISTITVIGSGLMGSGVAQVAAAAGQKVHLVDIDADAVAKAQKRIADSLERVAKKKFKDDTTAGMDFIKKTLGNLQTGTDAAAAAAESDLVLEAIVEDLAVKRKLFAELDKAAPSHTIFASNTSSLPIGEIASSTTRLDRFAGLHFFNPVPVMKLLEIIRTPDTTDATYDAVYSWGESIGKTCVQCKDTPGFIVNRLLVPYMGEAMRMLDRGDASARDIDTAMKLGAGYPMGPLELSDYVGLDTSYYILSGWQEKFPDNPMFAPPEGLVKLFKEGKFGMKTGEGIYKYDKKK